MRDLDVEDKPAPAGAQIAPVGRAGVPTGAAEPSRSAPSRPPQRDPAADLTPEDLVLKDRRSRAEPQTTAQPPPREVALMGLLAWVMMGLAIWHFTIFLPDRFWGGIVGAFVGSLVGAIVVGLIIFGVKVSALKIPGQKATDVAVVLYAIPGR